MNQDQVKEKLLAIEDAPLDFTVVFSGKASKKVNGLYKPENREVIIHNKNFQDNDNLLLYTAIHEYAHHLHCCARGGSLSARAHGSDFWAIFHRLLDKAEADGIYSSVFANSPELDSLTEKIRRVYLEENGNLMKQFGSELLRAEELCRGIGARFEDYLDRVLRIPKVSARAAIKTFQYNLNPALGPANMRLLAAVPNAERRQEAEEAFLAGKSPDTVREQLKRKNQADDQKAILEREKARIERTIDTLNRRLGEVEKQLEAL